jgi:hypothetical protein
VKTAFSFYGKQQVDGKQNGVFAAQKKKGDFSYPPLFRETEKKCRSCLFEGEQGGAVPERGRFLPFPFSGVSLGPGEHLRRILHHQE